MEFKPVYWDTCKVDGPKIKRTSKCYKYLRINSINLNGSLKQSQLILRELRKPQKSTITHAHNNRPRSNHSFSHSGNGYSMSM